MRTRSRTFSIFDVAFHQRRQRYKSCFPGVSHILPTSTMQPSWWRVSSNYLACRRRRSRKLWLTACCPFYIWGPARSPSSLVVGVLLWTAHSIPCLLSLDDVRYEQFYGYQTKWKFFLSHRTTSPWEIWLFPPGPEVAEVLPSQQHMNQQQQQRFDVPMSASVLLVPFYMP
jgi:hypothetical protein